jgi:hypothetical protein
MEEESVLGKVDRKRGGLYFPAVSPLNTLVEADVVLVAYEVERRLGWLSQKQASQFCCGYCRLCNGRAFWDFIGNGKGCLSFGDFHTAALRFPHACHTMPRPFLLP